MSTDPIWIRPEPGSRRPSLTRVQIADAAIQIADHDGIDAVSMRRLAQDLGVGTMSLYHYVRTKQELFVLMDDALMGELVLDEDDLPETDWRAAMTAIATSSRNVFGRHPWLIDNLGGLSGRIGPNGMKHFEQSVRATAGTGLDIDGRLNLIGLVDEYVFGYCARVHAHDRNPESFADLIPFVEELIETGEFPYIEELFGSAEARQASWRRFEELERSESRFHEGLRLLLDGVALDLQRRGL